MISIKRHLVELRRWLATPPHDLSEGQRTLRWWIDLARLCSSELRKDRASQIAAALTYHTLFSLMPTLVLSLVVLGSFVDDQQIAEFKEEIVNIALQPIQTEVAGDSTISASERRQEFDDMRRTISSQIQTWIDSLASVSFRSIGFVGILIFIWGATNLLSTIESSFNNIYGSAQDRPAYMRLPLYYTVLTLGPLVILAGQVVQDRFFETVGAESWAGPIMGLLGFVTPLLALWLVLSSLYILLPNTRVSKRTAMIGALLSSVLWHIAAALFTTYVQKAAFGTLYGALALLPLFLLWVWLTWLIVLFGLEVAYALQSMYEGRFAYRYYHEGDQIVIDRALLLPLATRIAESFERGSVASVADLCNALRLPPGAVRRLLRPLVRSGLIRQVGGRERGYTLGRPAADIRADQVLELGKSMVPAPGSGEEDKSWAIVNELYQRLQKDVHEITLADLAKPAPTG